MQASRRSSINARMNSMRKLIRAIKDPLFALFTVCWQVGSILLIIYLLTKVAYSVGNG